MFPLLSGLSSTTLSILAFPAVATTRRRLGASSRPSRHMIQRNTYVTALSLSPSLPPYLSLSPSLSLPLPFPLSLLLLTFFSFPLSPSSLSSPSLSHPLHPLSLLPLLSLSLLPSLYPSPTLAVSIALLFLFCILSLSLSRHLLSLSVFLSGTLTASLRTSTRCSFRSGRCTAQRTCRSQTRTFTVGSKPLLGLYIQYLVILLISGNRNMMIPFYFSPNNEGIARYRVANFFATLKLH